MFTLFKNDNIKVVSLKKNYIKKPIPLFKEWIEALRSGEHKQGRGKLCDGNGNKCCLGVMCYIQGRLYNEGMVFTDGRETGSNGYLSEDNPITRYIDHNGTLPDGIRVYYRSSKSSPMDQKHSILASLNDNYVSFTDIAHIIEACYCQLTEDYERA